MRCDPLRLRLWGLLLVVLISRTSLGQAVYGSIWGTIGDASGAPIRSARVTVTSVEKNFAQVGETDSVGGYSITHLVPDTYNVRVEAPGFKLGIAQFVQVYADQDEKVDVNLVVGQSTDPASAQEGASLVNSFRANVSTSYSDQELQNLPVQNRAFTNLLLFVPGAARTPVLGQPRENLQLKGLPVRLNGFPLSAISFELDGTEIPTTIQGGIVVNPPLESLREMTITTQNPDIEFGQSAAVVNLQTASGTNQWHGSAFEYRQSGFGGAGPPDIPNLQEPALDERLNFFGGSIGGPIVRNRVFVFGDYQGDRRSSRQSRTVDVPTETVRDTCLNPQSAVCDLSEYGRQIYDAKNHHLFSNGIIPSSELSSSAVAILSLFPAPNTAGTPLTLNNFTGSGVETFDDDVFDTRVDYNATSKMRLFARYSFGDFREVSPPVLGNELGGIAFSGAGSAGTTNVRSHTLATGFDYQLTPTLVTDFRFGLGRFHSNELPFNYGTSPADMFGIPGLNFGDLFTSLLPDFEIPGPPQPRPTTPDFSRFGYSLLANGCNCPLFAAQQQFQWVNNWTKIHGRHIIKWGTDLRYVEGMRLANTIPSLRQVNGVPDFNLATQFNSASPAGRLIFGPSFTSVPGTQNTTGLGLATFLLGFVTGFDRSVNLTTLNSTPTPAERQRRWFFYGQDTFRVTPKLTLTAGLRWEIYFPQTVTGKDEGAWLDINTGLLEVGGYQATNLHGNVKNSLTNFAPQLGLAYAVNPRTALRAGYRRSFDIGLDSLIFGDNVSDNPPIVREQLVGSVPPNPAGPGFYLSNVPQLPNINVPTSGEIPLAPGVSANVVPGRVRLPTWDSWNVSFEHQFNATMVLNLAYVGNKGTHVAFDTASSYDINQAAVGLPKSATAPLQPFFNRFGWTQNINYFGANASSNFHSLQAELEKRFGHDFTFIAGYTWSKQLDFSPVYFNVNPRIGYGPSDFDRSHRISGEGVAELPIGSKKAILGNATGLLDRVVSHWSLATTAYWTSGQPFSPTYDSGTTRECQADRDTGPCQPNIVGPVRITGDRNSYFTTTNAVSLPSGVGNSPGAAVGPWERPAPGTLGDAGRNTLRGPSFLQCDFSLGKRIQIRESLALQFRWDVYNVFNKVNLGDPNPCVDCIASPIEVGAGQISSLAPGANQRQMQFALRVLF